VQAETATSHGAKNAPLPAGMESGGASSPRRFCHGLCGKNHEPHSQSLRNL